jgi:hypothetical protein
MDRSRAYEFYNPNQCPVRGPVIPALDALLHGAVEMSKISIIKEVSNGAVEWLNSQCWHDSILYEIRFIRTNSADEVQLILDLIESYEPVSAYRALLVFRDCWSVQSRMNWGVECLSGGEHIDWAQCSETGELIEQTRETWSKIGLKVKNVAQFKLMMASTGSTLDLVFGEVEISNREPEARSNA